MNPINTGLLLTNRSNLQPHQNKSKRAKSTQEKSPRIKSKTATKSSDHQDQQEGKTESVKEESGERKKNKHKRCDIL